MKVKKEERKLLSVYCGTAEEKEEFIRQETDDYKYMIYMPVFNRQIAGCLSNRFPRLPKKALKPVRTPKKLSGVCCGNKVPAELINRFNGGVVVLS